VPVRLTESKTGIDHNAFALDAGGDASGNAPRQELRDFAGDVVIDGVHLHYARLALHVHQAHGDIQARRHGERSVAPKSIDVVQHGRAGSHRRLHDFGFAGIDGNGNVTFTGQALDQPDDTLEFFLDRHGLRTRAGGFTPDIDDVRALTDHVQGVV
jgi:hypothetical protein